MYSALLKVGQEEHMRQLFEEGLIYMNTTDFFAEMDLKHEFMKDPNEGVSYIEKFDVGELLIKGKKIVNLKNGVAKYRNLEDLGNLFAVYGIESNELKIDINRLKKLPIDISALDSGDTSVLITKPDEFLKRFKSSVEGAKLKLLLAKIEYVNIDQYKGKYGWRKKPLKYKLQKELRFFIQNDTNEPLKIRIGSISDIAIIMPKRNLQRLQYGAP